MAHQAEQEFCSLVKTFFPEFFTGVSVCDIGSLDINGNNHYLFSNYTYVGVDIGIGKNVNVVSKGHEFIPADGQKFDTVISTECFEHDKHWKETIQNIIDNLVKPGGLFLFTCATTGRPEHGTPRTSPSDSPFTVKQMDDWSTYYQNLTEEDIRYAIDLDKYFKSYHFYVHLESHDLYFWGILK